MASSSSSSSCSHQQGSQRSWTAAPLLFLALPRWGMPSHDTVYSKVTPKCGILQQHSVWHSQIHKADFQPDIKILNPILWLKLRLTSFPLSSQERPFLRTQTNSPTEREGKASALTDPVSLSTPLQNYSVELQHMQINLFESTVCLQVMGTEIPCTDRSPSPTTPTSGKICFLALILLIYILGNVVQSNRAQPLYSLCSSWTQTWRYQGGGSSRRLSDSECFLSTTFFCYSKWWSNSNFNTEKSLADIFAQWLGSKCFWFNEYFLWFYMFLLSHHLMFSAGSQWCGRKGRQPSVSD